MDKINAEMRTVVGAQDMKDWLTKMGLVAVADRPEEFRARMEAEIERWTKVVAEAGIKLQ